MFAVQHRSSPLRTGSFETALPKGIAQPMSWLKIYGKLRTAALSSSPVEGLTHGFYRYPARFSPHFAATAISALSRPGDLILDPFMGGGTSILEAIAAGRRAVGTDLNSLAHFVSKAKTTRFSSGDLDQVRTWCGNVDSWSSYKLRYEPKPESYPRNLNGPEVGPLRKALGLGRISLDALPSANSALLARTILLSAAQWALDGRKSTPTLKEFREKLKSTGADFIHQAARTASSLAHGPAPVLIEDSAENLLRHDPFRGGERASLVVTSPPYPGIHVLYHRWQIGGRRESPAPYWISESMDGNYASHYTFGDRSSEDEYFARALPSFASIRAAMKEGAHMVQLVAFSNRHSQLPRFLRMISEAGFSEVRPTSQRTGTKVRRIWRDVPGRRWHANSKGNTPGAREVVLVHRAR